MPDLLVTVGADASQYNQAMRQVSTTAQATSTSVTRSLAQSAASAQQSGSTIARSANTAGYALTNLGRVAQDAPFGFIAIQNNINPLLESFQRLRQETGSNANAFRALISSLAGGSGLGLAVSLATSALTLFFQHQQQVNSQLKAQKQAVEDLNATSIKEIATLISLYDASQNLNLSHSERLAAVNQLQKQYPAYFKNLSDESILAGRAKSAYDNLTQSIINQAVVRAGQSKLEESLKPLIDLITQQRQLQAELDKQNAAAQQTNPSKRTSFGQVDENGNPVPGFRPVAVSGHTNKTLAEQFFDDESEAAKNAGKDGLRNFDNEIKDYQKKIIDAKTTIQQMIQDFGINSLIDPDKTKAQKATKTLIEQLEAQLKALQDAENKWIEQGNKQDFFNLTARERNINSIIAKIEQLKQADEGVNAPILRQAGPQSIDLGVSTTFGSAADLTQMQNTIKALQTSNELRGKAYTDQQKFNESLKITTQVSKVFGQGLTNAFQSVLTGGQSFIGAMGQFLAELITRLIAAAAAAALLAVILSAVGFGTGFSGAATEAGSFKSLFGSFSGLKLADGGITQGPTHALIGEGREQEAVIPLSKLDQIMGGGTSSNQNNGDKIIGVLRGQNLLLQINRAQKSKTRTS